MGGACCWESLLSCRAPAGHMSHGLSMYSRKKKRLLLQLHVKTSPQACSFCWLRILSPLHARQNRLFHAALRLHRQSFC